MRLVLILLALLTAACGPPEKREPVRPDPLKDAEYRKNLDKLVGMRAEISSLLEAHKGDDAAKLLVEAQPLIQRAVSVPRPPLAALEVASDLDQIYGQMLFDNKDYGWARLFFQKNVVRWRYWQPQTGDTQRRRKMAEDAIAACDRKL